MVNPSIVAILESADRLSSQLAQNRILLDSIFLKAQAALEGKRSASSLESPASTPSQSIPPALSRGGSSTSSSSLVDGSKPLKDKEDRPLKQSGGAGAGAGVAGGAIPSPLTPSPSFLTTPSPSSSSFSPSALNAAVAAAAALQHSPLMSSPAVSHSPIAAAATQPSGVDLSSQPAGSPLSSVSNAQGGDLNGMHPQTVLDEAAAKKIEDLTAENLELAEMIREYQESLDLIMGQHRVLMAKLQEEREEVFKQAQEAIWEERNKNVELEMENCQLQNQIFEMARVMREAVSVEDESEKHDAELDALQKENEALRQLLGISSMQFN